MKLLINGLIWLTIAIIMGFLSYHYQAPVLLKYQNQSLQTTVFFLLLIVLSYTLIVVLLTHFYHRLLALMQWCQHRTIKKQYESAVTQLEASLTMLAEGHVQPVVKQLTKLSGHTHQPIVNLAQGLLAGITPLTGHTSQPTTSLGQILKHHCLAMIDEAQPTDLQTLILQKRSPLAIIATIEQAFKAKQIKNIHQELILLTKCTHQNSFLKSTCQSYLYQYFKLAAQQQHLPIKKCWDRLPSIYQCHPTIFIAYVDACLNQGWQPYCFQLLTDNLSNQITRKAIKRFISLNEIDIQKRIIIAVKWPQCPLKQIALATLYQKAKQIKLAITAYQAYLTTEPKTAAICYQLAQLYLAMNAHEEAKRWEREAKKQLSASNVIAH
ncbi:hypothetical protein N9Y17_04510 [Gammaproteobacteria bacterium]|nr:hypothetical protein [Gammaproteobacteria bacterium]